MGWRNEFPDFKAEDVPAFPPGFQDWSWHNDAAPSIGNPSVGMQIYFNPADRAEREYHEMPRYLVFAIDAEGCLTADEAVFSTEDWNAILHRIADVESELQRQ